MTDQGGNKVKTVKQMITEQSTTLFARSGQWVDFIADAVSTKEMDTLINAGNIMHAATRLQKVSCLGLTPTQVMCIINARRAELTARAENEDDGFPTHNLADLIGWGQLTEGVEIPF